jgi:predicted permease
MRWLARLIRRNRVEAQLDSELRDHFQRQVADYVAAGMTEPEARRRARIELGGLEQAKESCRDVRGTRWIEESLQDLRCAARLQIKRPGFAIITILTLALGIGANTAIFSVLHAVLLRDLPVNEPDRLVTLATVNPRDARAPRTRFSYPFLETVRTQRDMFSDVIAYQTTNLSFATDATSERVLGVLVSDDYFDGLGVGAAVGRTLTPKDNRPHASEPVVVLSYGFWEQRFSGDPRIIGRIVRVNGHQVTIVGVARRGFFGTQVGISPQLWLPLWSMSQVKLAGEMLENRDAEFLPAVLRLNSGVTPERAQAAVNVVYRQWRTQSEGATHAANDPTQLVLLPGTRALSPLQREFSRPLWVLMALVAMVLSIACVNVANLLMARAMARRQEITIRAALGGSRARILRQLTVESLLLSGLALVAGLGLAYVGVRALLAMLPAQQVALVIDPDAMVLAFSAGLSLLVGVILGLVPVRQTTRVDLRRVLSSESHNITSAGRRFGFRQASVLLQVTVSVVMLMAGALFVRSLFSLRHTDPGVNVDQMLQVTLNPREVGYAPNQLTEFYRQLLERVRALPNVRAAGFMNPALLSGERGRMDVYPPGYAAAPGEDVNSVFQNVSPGTFEAMGIEIVRGRDFTERDDKNAPKVIIVNEPMARKFFGNDNPIGRRIGEAGESEFEIVGVVRATKYYTMREELPRIFYVPFEQGGFPGPRHLYVNTAGNPLDLVEPVRATVRSLDRNVPLGVKTFASQIDESLIVDRLAATLSAFFGGLAVFLAALGLYGLINHTVLRRRRELAVRLALGAAPGRLTRTILRETLTLVLVGIIVGFGLSIPLANVVATLFVGVTPTDVNLLLGVTAVIALSGLVAAALPLWRVVRLEPLRAMREG